MISHHGLPWYERRGFPECKHGMSAVCNDSFTWGGDFVEQKSVSTTSFTSN